MKRTSLWGVGAVVALGVVALLLISQTSWATFRLNNGEGKRIHYDANNYAEPGDSMPDELSDRPGHDRTRDRHPDDTVDAVYDGTPDCAGNISGGGSVGNPRGEDGGDCDNSYFGERADAADSTPENQIFDGESNGGTFYDGTSVVDGVPDATRFMKINRALESQGNWGTGFPYARDFSPDWVYSDTYLAKIGGKNTVGDEDPDGGRPFFGRGANSPTMRPHDYTEDGDGEGGNPDNKRPRYAYGPGDKKTDWSPDIGGLGTKIGGGGGGGCSLVAGQAADPASGLAYLLVLLTPAALVAIRRTLRRK